MEQLEITNSEPVKPHVLLLLNTGDMIDVAKVLMMCHVEIVQDGPCSHYSVGNALHAKTLQRNGTELFQEPVICRLGRENPVVKLICIKPAAKSLMEQI